jgi:hypothetical protein
MKIVESLAVPGSRAGGPADRLRHRLQWRLALHLDEALDIACMALGIPDRDQLVPGMAPLLMMLVLVLVLMGKQGVLLTLIRRQNAAGSRAARSRAARSRAARPTARTSRHGAHADRPDLAADRAPEIPSPAEPAPGPAEHCAAGRVRSAANDGWPDRLPWAKAHPNIPQSQPRRVGLGPPPPAHNPPHTPKHAQIVTIS